MTAQSGYLYAQATGQGWCPFKDKRGMMI